MADVEQTIDQPNLNGSRGGMNDAEPSHQQVPTQSSDQLASSTNTSANPVPQNEQASHDFTAIPQSQQVSSEANYTTTSAASNSSLIRRGSRLNMGSKPSSRQGSKSDLLASESKGPNQSQSGADQPSEQQSPPKRSFLSVDNVSSSSNLNTNQQQQPQSSSSRRSSRRASAADIPTGSSQGLPNQLAPETSSRRSLLTPLTKTASAQSLTVGSDMRVLENMYNSNSAFNESNALMRSPSGSRPRLVGGKSKSMQSLLQGAKEAFEKAIGQGEGRLEPGDGQQGHTQQEQEQPARHVPSTSVPSVMVSHGDALDYHENGFYQVKAEHVGSETSLLERARHIPLPISRAGSLIALEFAESAPFLTFDRAPSVPRINQTDGKGVGHGQAVSSSSFLDAALRSPLPISRSPSFSVPFTSDLEDSVAAIVVNTSRILDTPLVADAQPIVPMEPVPTPLVYPVDRPVLAPLQLSQQVSARQTDLSFINDLTHEQLVQLAKVQYQQIQALHSIREQEVEHLSRSLSQARAENNSLRTKIIQLNQQPGSRSLSKQSSFADLPSTLQQALSCESVDDAINLIKNEPLGAAVPVAETQPRHHSAILNSSAQARHGSKQELAKKYGSGIVSVRSMREGDKREANASAMDIEKIRLKEDLTATMIENERLLEYLHLLISRIMEVPEAIKVLASPIVSEKPVMGRS